jgi:hypothetical protein
MKASQHLQKISAGVSLVILSLGFLSIGLVSLSPARLSSDSPSFSPTSCALGGWASVATASIFLFAACVYWRRYAWLRADDSTQVRDGLFAGGRLVHGPKNQEITAQPSWAGIPTGY